MRFLRMTAALAGAALLMAVGLGYGGWLFYDLDLLAHFRMHLLGLSGAVALVSLLIRARSGLMRSLAAAVLAAAGLVPLWEAPPPAGEGMPVTVMTANLYYHNPRPAAMRQALADAGADILLTLETNRSAIEGEPALAELYPHRVSYEVAGPDLMAVLWSKFPVLRAETVPHLPDEVPTAVRAVVEVAPGRTLSVLGLHLSHVSLGSQGAEVESLDEIAADLPRPLVVMGDFNATAWSWGVRRAEELTGTRRVSGVIRTWDGAYPTPFVRLVEPFGIPIDHVLVSPGLGVESIRTVNIPGSDHDAVRAVLRVPE